MLAIGAHIVLRAVLTTVGVVVAFAPLAWMIFAHVVEPNHGSTEEMWAFLVGGGVVASLIAVSAVASLSSAAVAVMRREHVSSERLVGAPGSWTLLFSAVILCAPTLLMMAALRSVHEPTVRGVLIGIAATLQLLTLVYMAMGGVLVPAVASMEGGGVVRTLRRAWTLGERNRKLVLGTFASIAVPVALISAGMVWATRSSHPVLSLLFSAALLVVGHVLAIVPGVAYARLQPEIGPNETRVSGWNEGLPAMAWVGGAVVFHLLFSSGGLTISRSVRDRAAMSRLMGAALAELFPIEASIEVAVEELPPQPEEPKDEKNDETKVAKDQEKQSEPDSKKPELKKPDPKKPEEKKLVLVKKAPEAPKATVDPITDRRIAVKVHADSSQKENPKAKLLAEQNNHVDEETQAKLTAHDQDDKNPTPGGNHGGNDTRVGDSSRTKIADSEDHPGEKGVAPGERGKEESSATPATKAGPDPKEKVATLAPEKSPSARTSQVNDPNRAPAPATGDSRVQPGADSKAAEAAKGDGTQRDPVADAFNGSWGWNRAENIGPNESRGSKPSVGKKGSVFGLNKGETSPGGLKLNLTDGKVARLTGPDMLSRQRQASGEKRRSEHLGSFQANNFERWRNAIENYVGMVKPGNQTRLNTAASPFATYLHAMHLRIHPIFADGFLDAWRGYASDHPLSDMTLITRLEIVLSKDGRLQDMGVVRTSGRTQFDVAALESVKRAQPFGTAPEAIVSDDGNVYLHWEFHRDDIYACSTQGARPFKINVPKPNTPPDAPPGGPKGPGLEKATPFGRPGDVREGMFLFLSPNSARTQL